MMIATDMQEGPDAMTDLLLEHINPIGNEFDREKFRKDMRQDHARILDGFDALLTSIKDALLS